MASALTVDNLEHRITISFLTEDYLAFLSGPRTEVWVGLWTYSQLESFRSGAEDQHFPDYKRNLLRKHFLAMGKLTTEATIKIWQSRQATELLLADYMESHPNTRYTPPKYRFSPNIALTPLTQSQLLNLVEVALQSVSLPIQRISLTKTKRKLTLPAVPQVPEEPQTELTIIPPLILNQAARTVRRKRKHGAMSLSHLFNHRAAQKSKIHWRRQRRAPIPLLSTTPITAFLNTTLSRKVAFEPPSSNTNTLNSITFTQNLNPGSGEQTMVFQDPVRIFNPG
jgi:hypothetical protein